jgi:hypothetical protein
MNQSQVSSRNKAQQNKKLRKALEEFIRRFELRMLPNPNKLVKDDCVVDLDKFKTEDIQYILMKLEIKFCM